MFLRTIFTNLCTNTFRCQIGTRQRGHVAQHKTNAQLGVYWIALKSENRLPLKNALEND